MTLTVFTPAYNRSHTLPRTYQSLCRQTCKDFEWLIVDDGSTDNTADMVKGWIKERIIPIRYIYQKNQGMHGAHNTAYRNIHTELNTCIDSDDYMPDDAVEKIITFWQSHKDEKYAGFIGLDITKSGEVIGQKFPLELKETTLRGYYEDLKGSGDKKLVYCTEVVNKYPEYPIFSGEKYVGLAYKYHCIDEDYLLLVLNEPLVIVDYQMDGSSRGMWKQYWNNPKGFAFYRKYEMVHTRSVKRKFMENIHYVSHSIRCNNKRFLQESPMPFLTFLCIIPGSLLFLWNKFNVKRNRLYKA